MKELTKIKEFLAKNVTRLQKEFAPPEHRAHNKFAKYCKVGNGAVSALKNMKGDPQLSTIYKIAARFGMEPWELLIEGATPHSRPRIVPPHEIEYYAVLEAARKALDQAKKPEPLRATPPHAQSSKDLAFKLRRKR